MWIIPTSLLGSVTFWRERNPLSSSLANLWIAAASLSLLGKIGNLRVTLFTAIQSEGSVAKHGVIPQDSQLLDAQSSSMLRRWGWDLETGGRDWIWRRSCTLAKWRVVLRRVRTNLFFCEEYSCHMNCNENSGTISVLQFTWLFEIRSVRSFLKEVWRAEQRLPNWNLCITSLLFIFIFGAKCHPYNLVQHFLLSLVDDTRDSSFKYCLRFQILSFTTDV